MISEYEQLDQPKVPPVQRAAALQTRCGARSKKLSMVFGAGHTTICERAGRVCFQVIRRFIGQSTRPASGRTPRPATRG